MSEIKLLPCPFCGGENIRMYAFGISPDCGVVCDDCGGCLEKEVAWTQKMIQKEHDEECKKVLIEAWNTRKPMQEICERLEEEIKEIEECFMTGYDITITNGMKKALSIVKEVGGMNE